MEKTVTIGNKKVGEEFPTFIVAEAGLNHNGRLKLAKELVQKAVEVNADAIKFQTYVTEDFISRTSPEFKLFKKYELSFEEFGELFDLAKHLGIIFFSTPLDLGSADFLEKLSVSAFKIASGDITDLPFIEHLSKKGKPIILSTGMATFEEVNEAVKVVNSTGNKQLVLLHCIATYPASVKEANLRAIASLKQAFDVPVGFSDHTLSGLTPIVAVAMGASVIEKHFTLDRGLSGPDHTCSFDIKQFKSMVSNIREAESMFGLSIKKPTEAELSIITCGRRSIVAKKPIKSGMRLSADMLTTKRPGEGIAPKDISLVLGKCAKTGINQDEILTWDKLQ
jgi:N-acetylneuraminate synthase/N,N'-diacetyllegionaminate synthase